jgi:lipid A 3-O-deacylase
VPNGLGLIGGLVALLAGGVVFAENLEVERDGPFVFKIYLENDGTNLKPNHSTDRHYTSGGKLTLSHQSQSEWVLNLAELWGRPEGRIRTALGFTVGQNIYTPDHVDEPEKRSEKDRVFAGYLYGGLYLQRDNRKVFDHIEINAGVIGPSSLGEESQKSIHDFFAIDEPLGWEDQLSDELAVDLIYLRKWKIKMAMNKGQEEAELIPEAGFMVGTVNRNLSFGLTGRYGVNLPDDYGPGRLLAPVAATGEHCSDNPMGYYVFARAGGKVIEHNRFLTGLSAEPFMGELEVGLVFVINRSLEFSYSLTFQTREFEEQSGKHSFATIAAAWRF